MASDRSIDAMIIVPPPSPSETNPPLGPMVLARTAYGHGLQVEVVDLNIEYLRRFGGTDDGRIGSVLGDHGKNRKLVAQAAEFFFASTGLHPEEAVHLPDTADARAGMHFAFSTLDRAVAQAASSGAFWEEWLGEVLFRRRAGARPPVVGISVMGPSQVFLALVTARLVKRWWPASVTVLGGSHATLLRHDMAADARYLRFIDRVLPGHSEEEFAALVRDRVVPGSKVAGEPPPGRRFDYLPLATERQLALYDQDTLTFPVQFTRGCSYGRCTYCTYPVVEPEATRLDAERAARAMWALHDIHGIVRFSVKDSLFTVPMMLGLADALGRLGTKVRWSATTKITRSLASHAAPLAAAGLATLEFGIETIHEPGQRLLGKVTDLEVVDEVLAACADNGIAVVINLIFGLPGETSRQADRQMEWYARQVDRAPGMVDGSLNMLEIVRGSPLASRPPRGVELTGIAPWAYCYAWNAPPWRREFAQVLRMTEFTPPTGAS